MVVELVPYAINPKPTTIGTLESTISTTRSYLVDRFLTKSLGVQRWARVPVKQARNCVHSAGNLIQYNSSSSNDRWLGETGLDLPGQQA